MKLRLRILRKVPDALMLFLAALYLVPWGISCLRASLEKKARSPRNRWLLSNEQYSIATRKYYCIETHGSIVRLYFLLSPFMIYKVNLALWIDNNCTRLQLMESTPLDSRFRGINSHRKLY
jgi:hypothetical protein